MTSKETASQTIRRHMNQTQEIASGFSAGRSVRSWPSLTRRRNPNLSLCLHQARLSIIAFLGAIGLLLCGCSTDVAATSLREQMAAGQPQPAVTLTQSAVSVDLPHGYSCDDLHLGSRWTQVGTIPEGDVYEDVNGKYQVRTGVSYYQADLVVKENALVGIYLPSQSAFVGTNSSPSLHWK